MVGAGCEIQNKHSPQGGACFPSVYFCFFNYGTSMSTIHACFIFPVPAARYRYIWSIDSPLIARFYPHDKPHEGMRIPMMMHDEGMNEEVSP